jgi:hypothetical protein
MTTIYIAIAFFALAAILGILLLTFVLRGKDTPKAIVFTHGPLAVIGFVLLLVYLFQRDPDPLESVILFAMAAIMGLVLVYKDLTGHKVPRGLAVLHGLTAVSGFVFLLLYTFYNFSWLSDKF